MKRILCLVAYLTANTANATLIDFENGLDPLFTYNGISFSPEDSSPGNNFDTVNGYETLASFTGSFKHVFNHFSISPSTFSWAGTGTFNLASFIISGAWGTQTLKIEGLLSNNIQFTSLLAVGNESVDVFSPHWSGIDAFRIGIGEDFVQASGVGGAGQQWAIDNLVISENVATVPVPSTLALLVAGLGLAVYRRRDWCTLTEKHRTNVLMH